MNFIPGSTIQKHGVACGNVGQDLESQRWDGDTKNMEYYAKGIRKFQRELKDLHPRIPKIWSVGSKDAEEADSENYWPNNNSCAHTERELEDYRLQELAVDHKN